MEIKMDIYLTEVKWIYLTSNPSSYGLYGSLSTQPSSSPLPEISELIPAQRVIHK